MDVRIPISIHQTYRQSQLSDVLPCVLELHDRTESHWKAKLADSCNSGLEN
jgi:hypothetical protein